MAQSQFNLLTRRRFWPLFVTQGLGAFNDNVFKYAVTLLITYRLAEAGGYSAGTMIAVAAGLFTLPFFLFSGLAGTLADKFDKAFLTRRIKLAEIAIMLAGGVSLWLESVPLMLAVIFMTGTQSAFFGPIKYGILPQHLEPQELIGGNALIETATFLAILLGTLFGGFIVLTANGPEIITLAVIVIAVAGWWASRQIPPATPAAPDIPVDYNIIRSTAAVLKFATERWNVFRAILGISWFWFLGVVFLTEIPAFAKETLGANEQVTNLFIITFTLGIGAGSLITNKLLKGNVSVKYVPIAAIATTLAIVDLWLSSTAAAGAATGELLSVKQFLSTWTGWRILADLSLIALFGGLFVVPLYAYIQTYSDEAQRSRVIASNNVINAALMTLATAFAALMLSAGASIPQLFLVTGLLNAIVAIYICKLLPQEIVKYLGRQIFRLLFRVELSGLENIEKAGDKVVIVANHTSFLDAPLIGSFIEKRLTFAVNTHVAEAWWVKPAFALFDLLPVDPANPMSTRTMVKEVQKGGKLVIFPEGRITVTGALMKVYEGPGTIAHLAGAKVLPVRIDGPQFSIFSRLKGKQRLRLFPKITVTVLEPVEFSAPEELKGSALRKHLSYRLYDVMSSMLFRTANIDRHLAEGLIDAARIHGGSKPVLEDVQRAPLTYSKLLTGSFALGRKLAAKTDDEKRVGVLLPNAAGCFLTLFGLMIHGKIAAMLNFSTGARNMGFACTAAELKTIITSRRFIELGGMEDDIAELSKQARIIYLEDIRNEIGLGAKILARLKAAIGNRALKWAGAVMDPEKPAVVLFTSGSEGVPKGVALSHRNLMANMQQVSARLDFNAQDIVFNAMPMFHSFGLTGGTLLPLLNGVRTFLYPSPLHYKIVPELCYDTNATVVFGTDTFLTGYARSAHPYDFYSIRYVVAGAERVKPETRAVWMEKFGKRILEGYGATECSPVLCLNTPMHFRSGTVGRLMDGIEYKLEPVDGIDNGGRLSVKGPNIMAGYLRAENPGTLDPPPDGWYDTGDIVSIDDDGYVTIEGRAKRFAKIGGEMVSLAALEAAAAQVLPEGEHAAASIPDAKKGERLVLITTVAKLTRKAVADAFKKHGVPAISVPADIVHVKQIPVLGTGKVDYVAVNNLAAGKDAA